MKRMVCLVYTSRMFHLIVFIAMAGIFMCSCMKRLEDWKTPDVPILQRESIRTEVMPRLACGSLQNTTSVVNIKAAGVTIPEIIENTTFDTNVWIYSSLAVKRLAYSPDMNMLFIVPATTNISDGSLHFLRIQKLNFLGLKMTALDCEDL